MDMLRRSQRTLTPLAPRSSRSKSVVLVLTRTVELTLRLVVVALLRTPAVVVEVATCSSDKAVKVEVGFSSNVVASLAMSLPVVEVRPQPSKGHQLRVRLKQTATASQTPASAP